MEERKKEGEDEEKDVSSHSETFFGQGLYLEIEIRSNMSTSENNSFWVGLWALLTQHTEEKTQGR